MPTLGRTDRSLPVIEMGISNPRTRRSAKSITVEGSTTSSIKMANSSPPKRAAVSVVPHSLEQTNGDLLQHLVAGRVAEAVVDRLEVVEVEEDHGDARVLARRAGERVVDAVGEQRSVGQPGDGVVEGLVRELLLERRALAGVAAVEHDAAHVLVVAEVGGERPRT